MKQEVEEFLLEVESVPVYFHEADILEQRVYEVNEWIRSAYKVIADVQQQGYYKASMELLSALIRSGELLKIKGECCTIGFVLLIPAHCCCMHCLNRNVVT